jgi:hypothetical protein
LDRIGVEVATKAVASIPNGRVVELNRGLGEIARGGHERRTVDEINVCGEDSVAKLRGTYA